MKKRGFTLIELLAVIIILAIIALIATPIVMNVIEKSKKGAAERSAENHLSTIETALMEKRVNGQTILEGVYDLKDLETKLGTIEISGQKATTGTIMIKDGQVLDGSTLEINGYVVNIVDRLGKIGEFGIIVDSVPNQTEAIKYDPVANDICTTGDTCYNWYVLEDKGTEYAYVSLIMDRNLGNRVAWCSDESLCKVDGAWNNSSGPITALNYLKEQTSSWTVATKLPTYKQIYQAAGNKYSKFPVWLYDYLQNTANPVPGLIGYWTSTPHSVNSNRAQSVYRGGSFSHNNVNYTGYGVRPVITISKSKLL